jgi:hypothetical protein
MQESRMPVASRDEMDATCSHDTGRGETEDSAARVARASESIATGPVRASELAELIDRETRLSALVDSRAPELVAAAAGLCARRRPRSASGRIAIARCVFTSAVAVALHTIAAVCLTITVAVPARTAAGGYKSFLGIHSFDPFLFFDGASRALDKADGERLKTLQSEFAAPAWAGVLGWPGASCRIQAAFSRGGPNSGKRPPALPLVPGNARGIP